MTPPHDRVRTVLVALSLLIMLPVLPSTTMDVEAAEITDDLISYYSFDADWTDQHGPNNLTTHGNAVRIANGINGYCADYDGDADYSIGYPATIQDKHTISWWMQKSGYNEYDWVLNIADGVARANIYFSSSTEMKLYYRDTSSRLLTAHWDVSGLLDGAWHHYVISTILHEDRVKVWIDGANVTVNYDYRGGGITAPITATNDIAWGGENSSDRRWNDHSCDELGFWSRELSDAEIGVLYNDGDGFFYPFSTILPSATLSSPANNTRSHPPVNFSFTPHGANLTLAELYIYHAGNTTQYVNEDADDWIAGTTHQTKIVSEAFILDNTSQRGEIYSGDDIPTSPYAAHDPPPLSPQAGAYNPILTKDDITDVNALFVADPFLFIEEGQDWYIFFEIYDSDVSSTHIALLSSDDQGEDWTYRGRVINGSSTLKVSYPYVFKSGGFYYMLPMDDISNDVVLWKASNFPWNWTAVNTLATPSNLDDNNIFYYNSTWWLMYGQDGNLKVCYSSTLESDSWTPVPSISTASTTCRPGGRVIVYDDHLVWFGQEAEAEEYGNSVYAYNITTLTTSNYIDEAYTSFNPILTESNVAGSWNKDGMHHYDPWYMGDGKGWYCVADGDINDPSSIWSLGTYHIPEDYPLSGYYESPLLDAGAEAMWISGTINATTPANTAYSVTYSDNSTWYDTIAELPVTRYIKYRINFTTTDSTVTPQIHDVSLGFYITGSQPSWESVAQNETAIVNGSAHTISHNFATTYLPQSITWRIKVTTAQGLYNYSGNRTLMILGASGTNHSGSVCGETWTAAGNPHYVVGDVLVNDSCTLTIEQGVEIFYLGNYQIAVNGTLDIQGTTTQHINVTGYNRQGSEKILVRSQGTIEIQYVDFSNLYRGIWLYAENTTIQDCTFTNCVKGIDTRADNTTIRRCSLSLTQDSDEGITTGTITINNLTAIDNTIFVDANYATGLLTEGLNSTIKNNTIYGDGGDTSARGIYVGQYNGTLIEGNRLYGLTDAVLFSAYTRGLNEHIEFRLNVIHNNSVGLNIYSSTNITVDVHYNIFENHAVAAVYQDDTSNNVTINATFNWWGSSNGANYTNHSSDGDDIIADMVITSHIESRSIVEQTVILYPAADAGIKGDSGYGDTNYGQGVTFEVKQNTLSSRITHFQFDLSSLPRHANVTSAYFYAYQLNEMENDGPMQCFHTPDDWAEDEITWNNGPALGVAVSYPKLMSWTPRYRAVKIENDGEGYWETFGANDTISFGLSATSRKETPPTEDQMYGRFTASESPEVGKRPYLAVTYNRTTTTDHEYQLLYGWNLIGVNVENAELSNGDPLTSSNLFNEVDDISIVTKRESNGDYESHHIGRSYNFAMEYGEAYYVYCSAVLGTTFSVIGDPGDSSVTMSAGWNLNTWVGDSTTASAIRSGYPFITIVSKRTVTGVYQSSYESGIPGYPPDFAVTAGQGYYFYCSSPGVIEEG